MTTSSRGATTRGATSRGARALLGAAHPGPAVAVTVLSALLAWAVDLDPTHALLVVAAVAAGQLSIGWCNDLVDVRRDSAVGRTDKPLVAGAVSRSTVRTACAVAVVACVPLSLACGLLTGLVHLVGVAMGWAYDLRLKATVWSWVPYAVAFASLPAFVSLAAHPDQVPPWWLLVAGALLGVGAHLVNTLPDLADDEATGVRGLPHRLGARLTPVAAAVVLVAATVVIVAGASLGSRTLAAAALLVVAALAVVALVTRGRTPFRAAVAMAVVDVAMLVWAR